MYCVFCEIKLPEGARCCMSCGRRVAVQLGIPGKPDHSRSLTIKIGTPIEEVEKLLILRTLQLSSDDKEKAARLLGISLKTLYNKLKRYKPELPDRISYRRVDKR